MSKCGGVLRSFAVRIIGAEATLFAGTLSSVCEAVSHAFALDFNLSPQHPAPCFARE